MKNRVYTRTKDLASLNYSLNQDKFLPVIDWTNKDVHYYLEEHSLSYHPLRDQGYLSIGDTHTTKKWEPGMTEEETRFNGLKRECGLHEDDGEQYGSGI